MSSKKEDQALIQCAQKGDIHAFARLVDKYKGMVYTLAYRNIKNAALAEEIAQDVFLKVHQNLNQYTAQGKFSSWLYTITYRKVIDEARKKKRFHSPITEISHDPSTVDENSPSALMEKEEQGHMIQNALLKLPEDECTLLSLYYFKELSIAEIVEITGLTKSNIKIKLHRSRKKLRQLLAGYYKNEII